MNINFTAALASARYLAGMQQATMAQFAGYENMMTQMNNAFDMINAMGGDVFTPANKAKFSSLAKNIDSFTLRNRQNQLNMDMFSKMYNYADKRYQQSVQRQDAY